MVVPSRDRPASLGRCLDHLVAEGAEVVVVDDASLDAGAVAAAVAGRATLLRGAGRGPAAARNRGAAAAVAAGAEAVAFVDDDCRVAPGWRAALVGSLETSPVAAGPTVAPAGASAVVRAAQVVTNHLVAASRDGELVGFAPTSNLAVRAEVLAALPFDEHYPLAAGEDRDWCDRVAAAGHPIAWEVGAVVHHHPDLDLRRFWRQQLRYGRGAHRFRSAGHRPRPPARFYVDLLRAGAAEGPVAGALVVVAQAATLAGVLAEARTPRP